MGQPQPDMGGMKLKVARTLKWNVIDKVASQLLYALTGLILANMLSPAEFGVVGAILVFQAFASLFVDSGFSYALIQRKSPTDLDYSTVLWFNMGMAGVVYVGLWFAAPWIMTLFKDAPEEDRDFLQLFSFICLLAFDTYMKKTLIEKLIDSLDS